MDENVSITVTVGERKYPLKIRAADEAIVREAEHLINEKFNEFQLRFTGQEKIDYLAMSALMNLVDIIRDHRNDGASSDLFQKKISEADQLLTEALKR